MRKLLDSKEPVKRDKAKKETTLSDAWDHFIKEMRPKSEWRPRFVTGIRTVLKIILSGMAVFGVPFFAYILLADRGYDISYWAYIVIVTGIVLTSYLLILESLFSLQNRPEYTKAVTKYPPATVLIVAYLPNEVMTIMESIKRFLAVEYPGDLQVILAYNTPFSIPVEETIHALAKQDARFLPYRIQKSKSKAQNINAVLPLVTGTFVGIFDADHHPEPNVLMKAWRHMMNGYDIVQGRCAVRRSEDSLVNKLVAVEFETIYGIGHPGRCNMHTFGIFGGSNGYWKTSVLRDIKMNSTMLTEDIDASFRALRKGYKIISDPSIISTELSPTTFVSLWNQRMRWAQGWFQVSLKHLLPALLSEHLSFRQKTGVFHMLFWREIYPWLSLQIIPVIAFWYYRYGAVRHLDWLVPIFLYTTLFTLFSGMWQLVMTYIRATTEVKRRKKLFILYYVASMIFYANLKNTISIIAQVRELLRENQWKVTPRTSKKIVLHNHIGSTVRAGRLQYASI